MESPHRGLGPLLFLIYINGIGCDITMKIRLFADDCVLYDSIKSISDARNLQQDLAKLIDWSDKWQMAFNGKKCSMLHASQQKDAIMFDYSIKGCILEEVDHPPYLGVELENDMSWNHHIRNITDKASRMLNIVHRNIGKDTPQQVYSTAYTALVRPHLKYTSSIWYPCQLNHFTRLGL